ncbi:MAG: sigma-70 family RNA polymerase sigma factor [Myxococcales bacterium]|nr:sigma-70 family RNA polymerase sigma factor [Myxococcales bacterium]
MRPLSGTGLLLRALSPWFEVDLVLLQVNHPILGPQHFVRRHRAGLTRGVAAVCRRYGVSAAEVDDIVHETLRRLMEPGHRPHLADRGTPEAYLLGVLLNVMNMARRRREARRRAPETPSLPAPRVDPDRRVLAHELLADAPPETRALVRLLIWEGASQREAAAALGVDASTISRRWSAFCRQARARVAAEEKTR